MTVKQIRVQNKYNRYAPGHGGFYQGKYHWDATWYGTPEQVIAEVKAFAAEHPKGLFLVVNYFCGETIGYICENQIISNGKVSQV